MTIQTGRKLNQLEHLLPEGLLVDARWLEARGYSRSLRNQYVSAGWLEQAAHGVFRRPRGTVSWEQAVISLQTLLGQPVSVGGRTALEQQGYGHYLYQSRQRIHLYSDTKLPGWLAKLDIEQVFVHHNRLRLLPQINLPPEGFSISDESNAADGQRQLEGGLRLEQWGHWNWPLVISSPERAILELLDELPTHETFHMADVVMEGLGNLSPRRMQELLENTSSIKVKRLFFFFADRHGHSWLKGINLNKINLGKGKRVLVKGGKLDPKYQITVPDTLYTDNPDGF